MPEFVPDNLVQVTYLARRRALSTLGFYRMQSSRYQQKFATRVGVVYSKLLDQFPRLQPVPVPVKLIIESAISVSIKTRKVQ